MTLNVSYKLAQNERTNESKEQTANTHSWASLLWFTIRVCETSAVKVKGSQWTCGPQTG